MRNRKILDTIILQADRPLFESRKLGLCIRMPDDTLDKTKTRANTSYGVIVGTGMPMETTNKYARVFAGIALASRSPF